jgi:hypothetical protein
MTQQMRQKVEYRLTEWRRMLCPALDALLAWAERRGAFAPAGGQRHEPRPSRETADGVRREKAALSSGCKPHPAIAPAGSNRSRHGGDEMSEAFG